MESITIKKTAKNVWMKKEDDYSNKFYRISESEAKECIELAKEKKVLYCEIINKNNTELYAYWN